MRAIGFSEDPKFPIDRNQFSSMQVAIPKKEEDDDDVWIVNTITLKVTSPNWDRQDKKRKWKGKDESEHERYFIIEDESFWSLVLNEKIKPHFIDTIKVDLAPINWSKLM
ncbi:MAG: hypothetical protein L3J83_06925 [Proteobacteria bacterium]|nr:hypothetical protein [Pseudomonadota bacterium]